MTAGPERPGPPPAGFGQVAAAYDTTGTEFFADLGRRLVVHAGIKPGDQVADLGCGAGAALIPAAVAAGPGGQVTGIDASPTMLARAGEAARARGVHASLRVGDAEDPPLPPGTVDVITASSVLQFLPRPRRAVRAWRELLVPGGRLAVSWGMRQDPAWMAVLAVLDDVVPRQSAPGFEEYLRRPPFDDAASLEGVLTAAGYADVVTRTEAVTTVYTGPEQWWAACRSQAPWVISWRHIPPRVLDAARDAAFALAEELRGGDGLIRRMLTFGCTIASRSA